MRVEMTPPNPQKGGKHQAPATPELVESDDWALEIAACGFANDSTLPDNVRSFIKDLWRAYCAMEERAAALEAQQARIAKLEFIVARFDRIHANAESAQALADRYEKALRAERDWHDLHWDLSLDGAREESACGTKAAEQALMRRATQHRERLEAIDQALSSQGRREGGAFDLLNMAEIATKAVYTHGFGFREVVGPDERDGKVYVNFALDDDRLVRAIFFVSPDEAPSPDNTNPEAEHG